MLEVLAKKLLKKEAVELTGFSTEKVSRLAELNLIKFNGKHYDKDSINLYLDFETKIHEDYYNIIEFTKVVGIPKYTGLHNIELHYPVEFPLLHITKTLIVVKGKYIFITKDSALNFKRALEKKTSIFSTHISTKKANEEYGLGFDRIKYYIKVKKLNPVEAPPGFKERGLFFSIDELDKVITEDKDFIEEHYSLNEVKDIFGYSEGSSSSIMNLVESGFLKFVKTEVGKIYIKNRNNTSWITKESVHSLLDILNNDYLKLEVISNKLDLTPGYLRALFSAEDKLLINYNLYILKDKAIDFMAQYDLDVIKESRSSFVKTPYNESDYYTLKGIERLSSRREGTLFKLLQKNEYKNLFKDFVEPKENDDYWKIGKKEVDNYLRKIASLRKRYYTRVELLEKLNLQKTFKEVPFTSIKMPLYMKFFTNIKGKYLYDQQETNRLLENKELVSLVFEQLHLEVSDYIKSFLNLRKLPEYLKETTRLLISFSERSLSAKQASPDTLNKYKRDYLLSIEYLINYKFQKELYFFDNTEIQLFIDKCPSINQKICLWNMLSFIEKERLCRYSLKNLPDPRKKYTKNEKVKISFEDWIEIYNHSSNLDIHINQAIVDKRYANLWLFTLILLTNAWRPSDVFRIPSIQPEAIGVPNIEWFKYHEITKPKAQRIINIIRSYKLVTAKNGMPRDFTCNLDLIVPLVTALCISEFHRRKSNALTLIDFTTEKKKQNTIRAIHFNYFFENSEKLKHLKFSPLIANRSLMEHLFYSIQEKKGKGNSAFELVMKFRNHKTDVTKEYIGDGGNKIALHLFSRGEFGFLYDQLVEILTGVRDSSLQERTFEISRIKSYFEPFEVVNTFNFLSKVMNEEEQNLMDKILSLTPDQALEHIRKMYLGHMPAKNPDAQCLVYPDCHRISNQYSCNQCPFAVHNVYALTAIFNEFEDSIQRYKNTNKNGVKQREQHTILKIQHVLIKAIEKFGEEYVFSFYTDGEAAFMQQLSFIEE